jgi:hypothetical protein
MYKITSNTGSIYYGASAIQLVEEIKQNGEQPVVFSYEGVRSTSRPSYDLIRENNKEMEQEDA